ncbi:hypothetical protein M9Y10_030655 [Tritrichomonas musculus]|uniref:Uncharacterized protein n=1 Tax=Tritrichomonas musculus TaxID=1915356 RepID=A0ABR2H2Q3_9EUKA
MSSLIKTYHTFVDEISNESIIVSDYENHQFEDYYYDINADKFYFYNGNQYRELHICENKLGYKCVHMRDINNSLVQVTFSNFKRLCDLY